MKFDKIAFLIFCNNIPMVDKYSYHACNCPYEWLCLTQYIDEYTLMIYSEGE